MYYNLHGVGAITGKTTGKDCFHCGQMLSGIVAPPPPPPPSHPTPNMRRKSNSSISEFFPLKENPFPLNVASQVRKYSRKCFLVNTVFIRNTRTDIFHKHCRPRSDAAKRGVWSESKLFATRPAVLGTQAGTSQREYNVETTSMQRHGAASTLMRRCINVMSTIGCSQQDLYIFLDKSGKEFRCPNI